MPHDLLINVGSVFSVYYDSKLNYFYSQGAIKFMRWGVNWHFFKKGCVVTHPV